MAGLRLRSASGSSSLTRTAVKTSAYTAAPGDLVPCDTTSAAFTVTLPNAPAVGSRVAVKIVTFGAGHFVTVACAGSDVFNKTGGATSATLQLLGHAMNLQYDTGGIWTVVADDVPKSQLDITYLPLAASPVTLANIGHGMLTGQGGLVGLQIDKPSASTDSQGGIFTIDGVPKWGYAMDTVNVDYVPVYDYVGSGVAGAGPADVLRVKPGGYFQMARSAGSPGVAHRLHLITDQFDDPATAHVLYLQISASAPTADYVRGQNNGVENFNINKSGQAAFGKVYSGTVSGGSLEVATAAVISATVGVTPALQLISSGNANNRAWNFQISTSDGGLNVKDVTSGNTPLQIQAAAASNTILIGASFLRLGAAASTVGFYANSGAAQSTGWTTMTGTATKAGAGFDTSTVTLPQLAQVVKAIVDRILAMNMVSA